MKTIKSYAAAAALVVLTMSGCANPYQKYYQGVSHSSDTGGVTYLPPQGAAPQLAAMSSNPHQDVASMFERGYGLIGYSDFTGRGFSTDLALAQARKVGAEVVLVSNKYLSTSSGVMPITTPTTASVYSNGTVSAYGSGGYATGTYNGVSTEYGTQTTYIPYSVNNYEQAALYFAQISRNGLGILQVSATEEQKQQAGTNKVIAIAAVRQGSPAYNADILPGDLLESVGGYSPLDPSVAQAYRIAATTPIPIVLVRNGEPITKMVQIPTPW